MFKNVIFEVGLTTEGFSIIRKQFLKPEDLSINPILVGEILSSIHGLNPSKTVSVPNVLEIQEFIIIVEQFECGFNGDYFLLYAICQASTEEIRTTLSKLAAELITFDNILLNWNVDTESLRNLYPLFEEAFLNHR
ncbi:MAG: hypothetical protein ACW98I_16485 [Candidatus Hodarchaeales archaeon]|jgi:hypothetical protein